MRIGIDARLWNETGVGRYIRNLVMQLLFIDADNDYVLFVRSKDYKSIKYQVSSIKGKERWKIVETDVHWHSIDEQIRFPQILYQENLDLMHFPYFSLPVFYKKPFVVTIHDLIINHFPTGKASTLPYPLYHLKRIGYDFVIKHAIQKSKRIIVPLNAVKEDVMHTFSVREEKIVVTYEGAESSVKGKGERGKNSSRFTINVSPYFLYVGNAYPHKNLEKLIEGFSLFKKETNETIKLVLVGKNDYFYKRLRAKVEKENLEDIIFKHNVGDEELFALYANALAFVSPSHMEGFGLPPLEAMSASCLVLLSDIPSFREVCEDAAFYFDPSSKESLKQQLQFVYNLDHKKKEGQIRKGLERVKQFSWKRMAEQTLNVYESSISIR